MRANSLKQAGPVPQRDVYFTVVTVTVISFSLSLSVGLSHFAQERK